MDISNIESLLAQGSAVKIVSTPFSTLTLRKFAKAALRSNTILTIVVGENLEDSDIDIICAEAPRNIEFDYTR